MPARLSNSCVMCVGWSCLILVGSFLGSALATAQDTGTLRVHVELATVEVVALGRGGSPALNLTKENFVLLENGKPREILSFDVMRESKQSDLPRSLADLDEQSRKGRVVLIFFDDGSIAPRQVMACREAAAQYVREHMEPWDLFAVAHFGTNLTIDQNLTHDVAAVEKALHQPATSVVPLERRSSLSPELLPDATVSVSNRNLRRTPADSPEEPGYREVNLARTLDVLSSSLALVKGRKSVLFFGSALSPRQSAAAPGTLRSGAGREIQKTIQSATELKVTYYPVDPRDSFTLNKAMDEVQDQLSHYYVLGYQPTEDVSKQSSKIEIKCVVPGIKLQYAKNQIHAVAPDTMSEPSAEEALLKAASSGTFLGQMPLAFRVVHFPDTNDRSWVTVSAEIQQSGVKFKRSKDSLMARLNVLGAAFDAEGNLTARFSETFNAAFDKSQKKTNPNQPIPYRHTMKLPPGHYSFRLAISDDQGKIGRVEQQLDIPKGGSNQLMVSSLVVSQQVSLLPELVRGINAELLQSDDPLLVNGMQLELPVEYKLSRQAPMILLYEVSQLKTGEAAKQMVADIQFVSKTGEITSFPPLPLGEVVRVNSSGRARVALKLPLTDVPKGTQTLRVATRLGADGQSVVAQESIQIVD